MYLLHLSDLHVCKENEKDFPTICDGIINALKNHPDGPVEPTILLITGDYTHNGSMEEYSLFYRTFFEEKVSKNPIFSKIENIILVPGNHDYPWSASSDREANFKDFVGRYGKSSDVGDVPLRTRMENHLMSHAYMEFPSYRVLVIGMNSMKIDSEKRPGIGYFDAEQLDLVSDVVDYYRKINTEPLYTFVAFHHHIFPAAFVERETLDSREKYSLTLDARRAIDHFLSCGIEFALHGHQHQPSMITIMDDSGRHANQCLHVISSGCLSDRERFNDSGRRSFILYEITEGCVELRLAETIREDSDKFEWQAPIQYRLQEFSKPRIDKRRIRDWAEKDNRWVSQADDVNPNPLSTDDETGVVSITDLVDMLVDGIRDDGSVAYYAGKAERYRTSTLATVLECVSEINLLPQEDILVMQRKLMRLRDDEKEVIRVSEKDDVIAKDEEDRPAWGIDEAPSVWTTSKALTALFLTKYVPQNKEEEQKLRDSVLWLARQQYSNGGWGYQLFQDSDACKASIPMTALALRALCLSLDFDYIRVENEDVTRIYNAIKKGAKRLLDRISASSSKNYWTYDNKPNLSASIWALQALDKAELVLRASSDSTFTQAGRRIQTRLNKCEKNVIEYVIQNLPFKDDAENITEAFFIAPAGSDLKYKPSIKHKKEFKSFTPHVLSYLLKADAANAERDEVKAMVKWVITHKDTKWLIYDFNGDAGDPCMISIAYSINIIVRWLQEISNRAVESAIESLKSVVSIRRSHGIV